MSLYEVHVKFIPHQLEQNLLQSLPIIRRIYSTSSAVMTTTFQCKSLECGSHTYVIVSIISMFHAIFH